MIWLVLQLNGEEFNHARTSVTSTASQLQAQDRDHVSWTRAVQARGATMLSFTTSLGLTYRSPVLQT